MKTTLFAAAALAAFVPVAAHAGWFGPPIRNAFSEKQRRRSGCHSKSCRSSRDNAKLNFHSLRANKDDLMMGLSLWQSEVATNHSGDDHAKRI